MHTRDDLYALLETHWAKGWPLHIDFNNGWVEIAFNGVERMIKVDPAIKFEQVKEKFGVIRIYYATSKPKFAKKLRSIVEEVEKQSAATCEETGQPGVLMRRSGAYRTLNSSFVNDGWVPVENGPFTTFITQY